MTSESMESLERSDAAGGSDPGKDGPSGGCGRKGVTSSTEPGDPGSPAGMTAKKALVAIVMTAFAAYMNWLAGIVAVIVIVAIIASVHEFGHYLASKAVGVRVDEFSLGLGSTKLWCRRIGETEYSIRPIPLGAFVKPAGMDPEEVFAPGDDPGERSFNRKGLAAKLAILVAGPLANIFLTIVIMIGLFAFVGDRPTTIVVQKLLKGKPAERAGIRRGDIFIEIDGTKITDYMEGIDIIARNAGRSITVKLKRPDDPSADEPRYSIVTLSVTPESRDGGPARIGMIVGQYVLDETFVPLPFGQACAKGINKTLGYVVKMYELILRMFRRALFKLEMPEEVGGPVKIFDTIKSSVDEGIHIPSLLAMIAWLSMSIGVFNLMPIPALDGGRILVLLIGGILYLVYRLLGREVPDDGVIPPGWEEYIHLAGFAFLILLFVVVTYKDVHDVMAPPTMNERLGVKDEELTDGMGAGTGTTAPAGMNCDLDRGTGGDRGAGRLVTPGGRGVEAGTVSTGVSVGDRRP